MSKKVKISILLIIATMIGFSIYSFLFGKLFPYSPIVIGFTKYELQNTIIYIEKGNTFKKLHDIDSLIPTVEDFHKLIFKKKPTIFLFAHEETYANRSISKARFCAFYNGNIVVSPWAQKEAVDGLISMEIYLRHELSHSLLHQHAGIIHASQYPKWLLEGIAVYSANQMGTSWYPSKEETYDFIRHGNFMPPRYFKTNKEVHIKLDIENRITFMYSEFACIVDYLINMYGKELFLSYMKQLLRGNKHDDVFQKTYKTSFEEVIVEFKHRVMSQS